MTRFVHQLTNQDSGLREQALLELSKKREDFPDLPVGNLSGVLDSAPTLDLLFRPPHRAADVVAFIRHDRVIAPGNYRHLPVAVTADVECDRVKPCVQRPGASAVCGLAPRDEVSFFGWCAQCSDCSDRSRIDMLCLLTSSQLTSRFTCTRSLIRRAGASRSSTCA